MSKTIRAPINPDILEWALKDLNLSPEDFAQKINVKPDTVKNWLNGDLEPTYKQLEKIAYKILKLPLVAFFLAEQPENLTIKRKFRTLPEYLLDLTSYKTRIAIKMADFYRSALYELFGTNPSSNSIFREVKLTPEQNPSEAAQQLRNEFNFDIDVQKKFRNGYEAFNYYRETLETKGIYLFQLQLEGDRGFCLLDNEFPVIVVNSGDSINSKIFTLFHELIHILIESDDIYKEVEPSPYLESNTEIFCNQTASEILVPLGELAERYSGSLRYWDEDLVLQIAKEYSVSKEVIFLKIVSLNYSSEADYKRLKAKWDKEFLENRKKRKGGSYYVNKISALGRMYINTVIDSYKRGNINDVQVSNYLGIKFTNLPKMEAEVFAQ